MIKKFLTIFFTLVGLFLLPQNVQAANYGLSISPPLLRIHIKPGKSITQVFTIENLSKTDQILIASIVPFTEADHFGNPILDPKANANWLSFFSLVNSQIKFDQPFTIVAESSEQLILSLSIPETAPLKDLYATLIVSTYDNSLNQELMGTSLRATIGSNLLITISSSAFPDTILKIEDFFPIEGTYLKIGNLYFVDSITPVKFTATAYNEGSFTAETKGVFRVSSNNKPVFMQGVLPINVIAKSKRQLTNTDGHSFVFSPSIGNIGTHQISLEIKTENSNTQSTINVFFLPLKLFLGLLLTFIIIISIQKFTSKPQEEID